MVTKEQAPEESRISQGDIEPVIDLLKGLSNPQRLMIVCALAEGELGVTDLERGLSIRQPSLSQHLGSLREAGIILSRREGKAVFYRLGDSRAALLVEALHAIFCKPAGRARQRARTFIAQREPPALPVCNPGAKPPSGHGEAAVFARIGKGAGS